jgi:adenylosuccinate synthase
MVKVVIGTQFGDEGKGRGIQLLAQDVSVVARYQGGANAGHTVYVGREKFVFRLVPSGIIYPHISCIMGNGMSIDPKELIKEIEFFKSKGIKFDKRFFISKNAHIVMPYHKLDDDQNGNIGTTRKGIGPCYQDKYARKGIRMEDLLFPQIFKDKVKRNLLSYKNLSFDKIYDEYLSFGKCLAPFITDTSWLLNNWIDEGKEILLEGAQGGLLDIDHGTYPFVTSSHPHSGGACCGLGIGPTKIDEIIGITKAYITRVGNGPLPTKMPNEIEAKIREKGKEYGATTGRPRRCGWFDAVLVKKIIMINDIKKIILTKFDVLDELSEIKICKEYAPASASSSVFSHPEYLDTLEPNFKPVYESMPGWMSSTRNIRDYNKLPKAAQNYLQRIEELLEVKIIAICVGPSKEETIIL